MSRIYDLIYLTSTIFLIFLNISESKELCPIHKCDKFDKGNNICGKVERITVGEDTQNIVSVKYCSKEAYCDVSFDEFPETQDYECRKYYQRLFADKEPCKENSECASKICKDKKCVGFEENKACIETNECISGYYCDSNTKKCTLQKQAGQSCNIEEECVNICGCYKNKCTKFWSLSPGTPIEDDDYPEYYCSTSFSYEGICTSISSNYTSPYSCDKENTCRYINLETNQIIEVPELCRCGINSDGKKYCQHGSDSLTYKRYLDSNIDILNRGCHVSNKWECQNLVEKIEVINSWNLELAWKGRFQLTDDCLIGIYSFSTWRGVNYYNLLLVLLIIFLSFI